MGPPRSSKKRPKANRAHGRVKEILALRRHLSGHLGNCRVRCPQRRNYAEKKAKFTEDREYYSILQRIMLLLPSGFPRVSKRTTTAMMMSATMAIPTYNGFIKLSRPGFSGVGLGIGDAAGGGDAFFSASIDCAYCKRWKVSLS